MLVDLLEFSLGPGFGLGALFAWPSAVRNFDGVGEFGFGLGELVKSRFVGVHDGSSLPRSQSLGVVIHAVGDEVLDGFLGLGGADD